MRRHQRLAGTAAMMIAVFGLAACGGGSDESAGSETSAAESSSAGSSGSASPSTEGSSGSASASPGASGSESPSGGASSGATASAEASEPGSSETAEPAGDTPAWAEEPTDGGDLISTVEVGDITVEVYQKGTAPAPKDGNWVDPETDEPIISEGDDLVFLNYVVTNNGDPIDLGSSLVSVSARYDDWKYAQGMGGITDSSLSEEMGIITSPVAETADPTVYTLGTGQSYSFGENFHYQPDSPITFDVTVTPVDENGDLIHDEKIEGEGTGTVA
jgi:hypothetical protein